jgi:uncharacterized protein YjiK
MNRVCVLLLVLFLHSCGNKGKNQPTSKQEKTLEPTGGKLYSVPPELNEISGISFVNDSLLVAIQDEEGILYFYDLAQEKVLRQYEFWKGKDYEDLAIVGNDLYVVSSSGTIYEIKNFDAERAPKANVYKTGLSEENNIEGLAYDKKNNRLLLGIKDQSLDKNEDQKDIYSFDLSTKTFNPKAVYSIRLTEVENYFKGDEIEEVSKKLLKALGNQNLNEVFRTSALNFNPLDGNLYVLSSMNNIVAVLNEQGKIIKILELDGKEFIQPEGLAFNTKGKLFISNEGRNKKANIIEIEYEN